MLSVHELYTSCTQNPLVVCAGNSFKKGQHLMSNYLCTQAIYTFCVHCLCTPRMVQNNLLLRPTMPRKLKRQCSICICINLKGWTGWRCSYSANVDDSSRTVLSTIMAVNQEVNSGKYLGLPALVGRKKEILSYIKERVLKRIQSWNNRYLSKAGREILLKTVIQAIPTYVMNVFLLPDNLISEIKRLMNGYWGK
ncbi:unnamed protein product [Cuscuta epithymum]|uniref:Reverse transcriptase n=1 Tax=Cuscuta epithymum TaxID=186058 RepID=A0AAV0C1G3_9ASTE|nr:unnamed protein product [Cuscuta epithymum]